MFKIMFSEGFKKLLRLMGMIVATLLGSLIFMVLLNAALSIDETWAKYKDWNRIFILVGTLYITGVLFFLFKPWWIPFLEALFYGEKPREEDLRDP